MPSPRDRLIADGIRATVTSAAQARPINQMQSSAKIRFIAIISIAFAASLPAQTSQPSPHRAEVSYAAGKLFVSANNSSLNQILRDISRETGMKITGGVTDERVFGQYGPDAPSKILNTLLDGTGSNMLLLQATGTTPAELILTPRQGGPTPPNPNASTFDDDPTGTQASRPIPSPERPQYSPTPNIPRNPTAADSPQQSPNAVKTPQQIYEQLLRMRQLQQQQQQSNPQ